MLTCNWKLAKHVYYLYNSSSILSNYLQWPLRLELSHLNPYLWLVWDWLILKLLDMFRLVQGKTSIFNLKYIICKSPVLTDYVKKQIIDFCDLIDIFGQLVFHNFFWSNQTPFLKSAPAYLAFVPNSSSILRSWLYLANLSDLQGAPVLIWPVPRPTTRSAMKQSSVSPDLNKFNI